MTNIEYVETIDSTNDELKRRVKNGLRDRVCLVADSQTKGRGRKGRVFYSPGGNVGIYMSYLYYSDRPAERSVTVTTAVSVMAAKAINEVTGADVKIKWVNDIYLNNRKISGILTELVPLGDKNAIIVGIGINIMPSELPEEIKNIAGSVLTNADCADFSSIKKAVVEKIVNALDEFAVKESLEDYIEDYIKLSCVLGKQVIYSDWNGQFKAKVLSITEEGHLQVELENGEKRYLDTGEITLRIDE